MKNMVTVMTAVSDQKEAAQLAKKLVQQRLAACVQEQNIQSHYNWEGEIQCEAEVMLLIKTKKGLLDEVISFIKNNHSYDLPEIIALPVIDGLSEYIDWVEAETKG